MKNEKKFLSLDDNDFMWNSLFMFHDFNKQSSFGIVGNMWSIAKDNEKDINLFINSYGGAVDDLFAMIDIMNIIDNDIATIGLGCCASCGSVLLACGTKGKRYMTENARLMMHQISSLAIGKNTDVQIQAKEADRINNQLASILAKATGKSKKQILEDFKDDKWFTAEEALEYGLIDKIIKKEDIKKLDLEKKNLNKNNDNDFHFKYEIKSFQEEKDYYTLEGVVSTPDVDLLKDIVEQEALINSVEKYGMPSFLHLHKNDEKPLGTIEKVYLSNGETWINAKMPKGIKDNDEIAILIRNGAYKGMSIGYSVLKYHHKNDVRIITEIIWHETSLVNVPCNPKAKIKEFKNLDFETKAVSPNTNLPLASRDRDWDKSSADKRIRSYTNSDEKPSSNYKKFFMYYDAENKENFTAYKLPFADIINGKAYIIPRAIFAIAGVLQGARGGVDIPESEKAKIKSKVNALYKRMATEFDDENLKSPLESNKILFENAESLKDVENILQEYGLSKKEFLACIFKIKELSLNIDNYLMSDLSNNPSFVSDLQTFQKTINTLQKTVNNILGKNNG